MQLRFHPEAFDELRNSADYYAARSADAARKYALAVERSLQVVVASPQRFRRIARTERACRVWGFPFQLVYRVHDDCIFVIAVAHTSRRPGYWKSR